MLALIDKAKRGYQLGKRNYNSSVYNDEAYYHFFVHNLNNC